MTRCVTFSLFQGIKISETAFSLNQSGLLDYMRLRQNIFFINFKLKSASKAYTRFCSLLKQGSLQWCQEKWFLDIRLRPKGLLCISIVFVSTQEKGAKEQ